MGIPACRVPAKREIIEAVQYKNDDSQQDTPDQETAENDEIEEGGIKTVGEALLYVRQLTKFLADKDISSNRLDGIL